MSELTGESIAVLDDTVTRIVKFEVWDNSDDGYGDGDYEKKGLVRIDV